MKAITLAAPILSAFFILTGFMSHESSSDEERKAVLKTLESWNEGWKKRDAVLAVSDYAEGADWTNAFGDRFQSRIELREGLEFIFSLDFVMIGNSQGNEYQDVTFIADDVAIIRSRLSRTGQLTDSGQAMRDREINHLRVLKKRDGRWLIVSHLISQAKEKGSL